MVFTSGDWPDWSSSKSSGLCIVSRWYLRLVIDLIGHLQSQVNCVSSVDDIYVLWLTWLVIFRVKWIVYRQWMVFMSLVIGLIGHLQSQVDCVSSVDGIYVSGGWPDWSSSESSVLCIVSRWYLCLVIDLIGHLQSQSDFVSSVDGIFVSGDWPD